MVLFGKPLCNVYLGVNGIVNSTIFISKDLKENTIIVKKNNILFVWLSVSDVTLSKDVSPGEFSKSQF